MKLNIQSTHTPGLLLATNLVQLANSIAHARTLVTAAYSHAREIATAEANHAAADFCGDPYAHNCGRPHCRPSDSYTGPQPPLARRFFEVEAVAEATSPAAGVPEGYRIQVCKLGRFGAAYDPTGTHYAYTYTDQPDNVAAMKLGRAAAANATKSHGDEIDRGLHLLRMLQAEGFGVFDIDTNTPPASEQQHDGRMPSDSRNRMWELIDAALTSSVPDALKRGDICNVLAPLLASEQQRAVLMEELLTCVADWCDQQPKHDWYGRTAGDMVRAFMARHPTPPQENDR
ncbi:hypothetical protein [Metapseudomonas otitidis]|uniref:hypothetical protein n=1 Tax=Metapseudomonas otitidis TaxID=319939 RepID=UPI0013F5C3D9|nr:hypothetical protein [Pseudomonas otitidis]